MSRARSKKEWPASDAALAGLLFAVDPHGLGGVILRGMPGPVRDGWLRVLRSLIQPETPWSKVPVSVSDDRLIGGLDFAATIASGKPVHTRGLLQAADGGVVIMAMAERVTEHCAAVITSALDRGGIQSERDGLSEFTASQFGVVALDEGIDQDERLPDGLADRLAFAIDTRSVNLGDLDMGDWTASDVAAARGRLEKVITDGDIILPICQSALALGIPSLRAEVLTLRVARVAAALRGLDKVGDTEATLAARLVLAHRARRLPQAEAEAPDNREDTPDPSEQEPQPPETSSEVSAEDMDNDADLPSRESPPDDVLVDAVSAAIPPGLLALLQQQNVPRKRQSAGGRGEARTRSRKRGRPIGVKPAETVSGQRLNILATLKAAAPWQKMRNEATGDGRRSLQIRREDLHTTRFQDRTETTIVFAVDASGSQAAQRLAEVKGAIEMLLQDCYVRRDQVAMVTFRGTGAEVLLSPTRSLARAKRLLAALPGGGGTPLADGIDKTRELAESIARQGRIPAVVMLTDGRANIRRDEQPGAEKAEEEALAAAKQFAADGFNAMLVDTSRRPRPRASALAKAMGARYLPLPQANAKTLSQTVQRGIA